MYWRSNGKIFLDSSAPPHQGGADVRQAGAVCWSTARPASPPMPTCTSPVSLTLVRVAASRHDRTMVSGVDATTAAMPTAIRRRMSLAPTAAHH